MTKQKDKKRKKTKSLNAKLFAYTVSATGVLAMAPATHANIVHTDPVDIVIGPGGSQDISFLCNEFQIRHVGNAPTNTAFWVEIADIGTGNNGWLTTTQFTFGTTYTYARRLTTGNVIGPPAANFKSGAEDGELGYTIGDYPKDFRNATGFIGVKFQCAGSTYYGWIRFTGNAAGDGGTIHEWAYEDTPNTAIDAGETPPPNNAPEVDLNGGGGGIDVSRSFTEDVGAVTISPAATVTDADGDEIATITITLTNNLDGGAEGLFLGSATNVTIAGSGTTTLTLSTTGTTTNAQFQAALQAVTYNNTSDNPNTTARSITVVANDGTDNSTTATVTMSITPQNDPPTDISLSNTSVDEEQPSNTAVGTLTTTDPDN